MSRVLLFIVFALHADLSLSQDNDCFYFIEHTGNMRVDLNPVYNLRASLINGKLVRGLHFANGFSLSDTEFKSLREKYLGYFPTNKFGSGVGISPKNDSPNGKVIKCTIGRVIKDVVNIQGQLIIYYKGVDENGYPLISGIDILPENKIQG